MKNIILTTMAALAAISIPASATAQSEFYAETGGWTIYKSERACYMAASYEGDAVLSVYIEDMNQAAFWLQNPSWKSVRDGARYTIDIEFDDLGRWEMPALGKSDEDGPGITWIGNISTNSEGDTFMGEFMIAKSMRVSINGREIGSYSMDDTRSASLTLSTCLRNAHRTSDPFEGLQVPERQEDPFFGT